VHEALAQALGYRDWHELSIMARQNSPVTTELVNLKEALRIIVQLADALVLPEPDVQHAVSKARLLSTTAWSTDDHMLLRSSIWRERFFGMPGRGKPETIVQDRAHGATTPAYLRHAGRPTYLLFDGGLGERADFDVVMPRTPFADFVPSRIWLPYGIWRLTDGSEVVFSRDYLPMWRISKDGVERLAPWLWIRGIVEQVHFTGGRTALWAAGAAREKAAAYLQRHRISELPKLTDIMPHLFKPSRLHQGGRCAPLCRAAAG
jgi:hypothetical protein